MDEECLAVGVECDCEGEATQFPAAPVLSSVRWAANPQLDTATVTEWTPEILATPSKTAPL